MFLSPIAKLKERAALISRRGGLSAELKRVLLRVRRVFGLRQPETWRIRPGQVQYALTARLRGSSDMSVFHQVFIFEEYRPLRGLTEPSLILDLGANVGFSAAYFLSCFPKARLVAVEPDERNLKICRMNLAPYGVRAQLLPGAVWSKCEKVSLSKGTFGDGREWATEVRARNEAEPDCEVQAWDIPSVIDLGGGGMVDLLKIDIERAELAVFREGADKWLPRVRNICIELHGQDCEDLFFSALEGFDYELEKSGELTICRNIRAHQVVPQTSPHTLLV